MPTFNPIPITTAGLRIKADIEKKFLADMNQAISDFNTAMDGNKRLEALKKMEEAFRYVELHNPPSTHQSRTPYYKLKGGLEQKIKQAYAAEGKLISAPDPITLEYIISTMPREKAENLALTLQNKPLFLSRKLANLYPSKDQSPEAKTWREFLKNHSVEFVGGNHSKNYLIKGIGTASAQILKVDDPMGSPKRVAAHARSTMPGLFTGIYAGQSVEIIDKDYPEASHGEYYVTRGLVVTDFCPGGSALTHSAASKNTTQRYENTANILGQMASALIKLQGENIFFPDSKLDNWLVDERGILKIGDSKSLLFSKRGNIDLNIPENKYFTLIYDAGFTAGDLEGSPTLTTEQFHAGMLGRNIEASLTLKPPSAKHSSHPIYQGDIGEEYKKLAQALTVDPPEKRMSLSEARKTLVGLSFKVESGQLYSNYLALLTKSDELSKRIGIDVTPLVYQKIQAELASPTMSKAETLEVINDLLEGLALTNDKCTPHIQQISLKNPHKTEEYLQSVKTALLQNPDSLDGLKTRFQEAEVYFNEAANDIAERERYSQLYSALKEKWENNAQMEGFLAKLDENENPEKITEKITKLEFLLSVGAEIKRSSKAILENTGKELLPLLIEKLVKTDLSQDIEESFIDKKNNILNPLLVLERSVAFILPCLNEMNTLRLNDGQEGFFLRTEIDEQAWIVKNLIDGINSVDALPEINQSITAAEAVLKTKLSEVTTLKDRYDGLKTQLNEMGFTNDKKMAAYLTGHDTAINRGKNSAEKIVNMQAAITEVLAMQEALSAPGNQRVLDQMHAIVKELTLSKRWWTVGKGKEVTNIMEAFQKIPLEVRKDLASSDNPAVQNLRTLLDKHHKDFKQFKETYKNINPEQSPDLDQKNESGGPKV